MRRTASEKGGKLDRFGIRPTPGMPHIQAAGIPKRNNGVVGVAKGMAEDQKTVTVQQCPCGVDQRFTVKELPAGYVSQLDPMECRPWAALR